MSPRKRKPRRSSSSRRAKSDPKLAGDLPSSPEQAQPDAQQLPTLIPQPHGGALLSGGVPGHVGAGGRPPEAFRDALAKVRQNPRVIAAIERAAADPDSRGFASALKVLTDYDTDKPAQKLELTVEALAKMSDDELEAIARGKR